MKNFKDEKNKVYALNDLQINQGVADKLKLTLITRVEAEELMTSKVIDKTQKQLAHEAQAYLDATDYIYLSQKEKSLSDKEVAEKHADIITKRIEQRSIVSDYEDSL